MSKKQDETGIQQAQAIRLHTALVTLVQNGRVVINNSEIAKYAQVNESVAKMAISEWHRQDWLKLVDAGGFARYLITESCPSAPNAAAIDVIGLLQVISETYFDMRWLTYGYGSALSFHGESDLVQHAYYIFHADQTVTPPKLPEDAPFKRAKKTPTQWGIWQKKPVYYIRRHPNSLRPYQQTEVNYQGVNVPVTSLIRTLIDCWLRPDLCGGEDRMLDAWVHYLEKNNSRLAAIRREILAIMKDSLWKSASSALASWLPIVHSYFDKHPLITATK